jgi:hypothetical protein
VLKGDPDAWDLVKDGLKAKVAELLP